jgi:ribonuclease HII
MIVVGIDEVGRGCLAGPVVACAIILKPGFNDTNIVDSKKVSEKKRERLSELILSNSSSYGIGIVCSHIVDKINILNATKQAMHLALSRIKNEYEFIKIDAVKLNNLKTDFIHPFKAEDNHIEVAAASIVAKVYRDNLMKKMHLLYPSYNWQKNKGYGTKEHMNAIDKYGITLLHRKSFLKGKIHDNK